MNAQNDNRMDAQRNVRHSIPIWGQLFYILLTLTVQFLDAIALSTTCANLASQRGVWIDNQHFYIVQCMAFFVLKFR